MNKIEYELLDKDHVKQLGLIVLQSDVTIEDEFRYYFSDQDVSLFVNRIPFENKVSAETLKQMEHHLADTMSLFPIEAEFDALGYACTSGAMHIGADRIEQLVSEVRPCKTVTNPMTATIAALELVNGKNIAYLGPYSEKVCNEMIDLFTQAGIKVSAATTYDESEDRFVGRISPNSIQRDAIHLAKKNPQIEALFIACTNMKCAHIIPEIEAQTGITVISSNQALAWDLARHIGLDLGVEKGHLFR